jgi:hypothetical protein
MHEESKDVTQTTPVYVPYATLISSLDALQKNGIPSSGVIDKTIWDTQSGTIRGQLILAYKFLGFIDGNRKVLPTLPPLVAAAGDDRKPLLRKVIEDKYRSVISEGLATISPGQFNDAFRKLNVDGSTLTRATRFFVKACVEVGIPIAKRFSERTRASGPRKKRAPNSGKQIDEVIVNKPGGTPETTWEEKLLEKFPKFDPEWSEELKTKWFEGFGRLMGAKPE